MDDEEAIPEKLRELVKRRQDVWRAERQAFDAETRRIVANVLGLSTEQVGRHEWRTEEMRPGEIIFVFQVPDDVPYVVIDLAGPPYVLTICRDLRSPANERWTLRLEGVKQPERGPRRELPRLPRGGFRLFLEPLAVWSAAELSVDLVAQASAGVGFDYGFSGTGERFTLVRSQMQRTPEGLLKRRLLDLETDVSAIRKLLEAEPRARS